MKSVAEKARIKPGTTVAVINPVDDVVKAWGVPTDVSFVKPAAAQIVLLFVKTRAELQSKMPRAVEGLAPGATVWVMFRKGSKAAGLDMKRDDVWEIACRLGVRPVSLLSVDETWSAFRFRRAK
jgi:hypothetical protein